MNKESQTDEEDTSKGTKTWLHSTPLGKHLKKGPTLSRRPLCPMFLLLLELQ